MRFDRAMPHAPRNILMWFRADLRTADNTALRHAAATAREERGRVIGVFTICPGQWREHDWSGVKVEMLLGTLRELSTSLGRLGIPLLIRESPTFAGVPALLLALAREHGCRAVYFNDEYEVNESRRDKAVAAAFTGAGLEARGFTDQVIFTPGAVRTGEGRFFTVYTPFKKAYYRAIDSAGGLGADGVAPRAAPSAQESTGLASDPVPQTVPGFVSHVEDGPRLWPPGESQADRRLDRFVETRIVEYKQKRDFPSIDATSTLSPYLAIGAISPRQCLAAAAAANGGLLENARNPGATHWISELVWREFYKHILVGFPRVSKGRAFRPETERLRWRSGSAADADFEAWCEGRTGVPIVDAGMRQLQRTGWMHNRLRMITAMFLSKDLFIDWRRGESHFMRHLVDGDISQNNGGWQWSASTGTDAAPYFRVFNPVLQSRRFDPQGEYIREYVPELRDLDGGEKGAIHDPSQLPALLRSTLDYPEPILGDRARSKERVMTEFKRVNALI